MLEKELTPVERYAVLFLEETDDQYSEEAVKQAEVSNASHGYLSSWCAYVSVGCYGVFWIVELMGFLVWRL